MGAGGPGSGRARVGGGRLRSAPLLGACWEPGVLQSSAPAVSPAVGLLGLSVPLQALRVSAKTQGVEAKVWVEKEST